MKHDRSIYASVGQGMGEKLDCSLRAASTAGGIDYALVHAVFAKHGRQPKHATLFNTSRAAIYELFGSAPRSYPAQRITLATFVRLNPTGNYIVHVRGHALAICDGVIHDWKESPRRVVKCYWRVPVKNDNVPITNAGKE